MLNDTISMSDVYKGSQGVLGGLTNKRSKGAIIFFFAIGGHEKLGVTEFFHEKYGGQKIIKKLFGGHKFY